MPTGHCYAAICVVAVSYPSPGSQPTVEAPPGSSDSHLRPEQDWPPAAESQQEVGYVSNSVGQCG